MFDCISFECIKRLIFCECYNKSRRILSEDLLILILDYSTIPELIELKKVSPQFSYCVKELAKRKLLLVLTQNRKDFQSIFHTYHKNSHFLQNLGAIKNSVIHFEAIERNEKNESLKFVYKQCIQLNALAIGQQKDVKQIEALNKFAKRIDSLCLGSPLLSSGNLNSIETKVEKIGTIFGNTIRSLSLNFEPTDKHTSPKIICLLERFTKLETFKVSSSGTVLMKLCNIYQKHSEFWI